MFKQRSKRMGALALLSLLLMALVVYGPVLAQNPPIPVTMGTPALGEVSVGNPAPRFSINIPAAQSLTVQALAVTPGFVPSFNVYDPSGALVQSVPNPNSAPIVEATFNLPTPGTYVFEVLSVTGTPGPFVLSVTGGPAAAPAPTTPLAVGQGIPGSVNPQAPKQLYTFSGSATDVLLLTVRSDAPSSGPVVSLRDIATGQLIALSNVKLIGVRFRIPIVPPGALANYAVEVAHSGSPSVESYIVCLETESNQTACPGGPTGPVATENVPPPATFVPPPINPNGPCSVATGQNVNIRIGPSTAYNIAGTFNAGSTAPVIGRLADNSWYQINANGVVGWVSAGVVVIGGQCGNVPVVPPPPPPGVTASATFTPTATATATATATEEKEETEEPTEEPPSTEEPTEEPPSTEEPPEETQEPS